MTSDDTQGLSRFARRGEDALHSLAEQWDRNHPDGESGTVKWVSITDGRRTICYFLLFLRDGEVYRVGLARKRKGLPPNPYDRGGAMGMTDWYAAGIPVESPGAAEVVGGMVERFKDTRTGRTDSDLHPGTPLTMGVHLIPDDGGDHRWQLPGFKVRGSVLAKVLYGVRREGAQQVPLALVRSAAQRYGD